MSEEKYCKFCNKTKPIKEFVKSGMCFKNICKECHNKKQRQVYQNNKLVEELEQRIEKAVEYIKLCKEENCEESDNYIDNDYALYNLLNILNGRSDK